MTQEFEQFQAPPPQYGMQGMPGGGPQMMSGQAPMPPLYPDPNAAPPGYEQHPMATGQPVPQYAGGTVQLNLGPEPTPAPQHPMSSNQGNAVALANMQAQMEILMRDNQSMRQTLEGQVTANVGQQQVIPQMNPEEKALRLRIEQIDTYNAGVRRAHAAIERMRDELIKYEDEASKKKLMPVEPLRRKLWNMTHGTMEGYQDEQTQRTTEQQRRVADSGTPSFGTGASGGAPATDDGAAAGGRARPDQQAGRNYDSPEHPGLAGGGVEGASGGRQEVVGDTPGQLGNSPANPEGRNERVGSVIDGQFKPIGGLPIADRGPEPEPDPGLTIDREAFLKDQPDPGVVTDLDEYVDEDYEVVDADAPLDPDRMFAPPTEDNLIDTGA